MSATPPPHQQWWHTRRYGLMVHASAAAVPAWAPVGQYADWYLAHLDGRASDTLLHPSPMVEAIVHHRDRWDHVRRYDDFVELLHFDQFDPDAWAALAVDGGMTYSVMMAKHHDGLCWWDAPGSAFTVTERGPRRNVLGEYAEACRRAGLEFGASYSLLDWSDARYPGAAYVEGAVHPQVLDLVERYGVRLLWGDGHWGGGEGRWRSDELIAAVHDRDPTVVVNDRWRWDGPAVSTFEYQMPATALDRPWELRRGLGTSFGHNRAEASDGVLDAAALISVLTETIAKGGHLLLALGVDAGGELAEDDARVVRDAGDWVRRHATLVHRSTPWTQWGDAGCRYLTVDGVVHVVDVAGLGHFAALGRDVGRVLSVALADGPEAAPIEFEQGDGLQIVRRRMLHRPPHGIAVYRIEIEAPPPAPIELFPKERPATVELATALKGAARGQIVQLGDATYVGPAHVPDGVIVRGLGPGRTLLDGAESAAVTVGAGARVEHCSIRGGANRIVWLPKVAVVLSGRGAALLGCTIDGHVAIEAVDGRVTSCTATGVVATGVDHVTVTRSTLRGMNWDCAIDVADGSGHLIESCDIADVLVAVRLTRTTGAVVRGNRIRARWWGVHATDTQATLAVGNSIATATRAFDVDGGTLAEITGNVVSDGDSGCVVQRGASAIQVTGNRWERTRIGLLAWDSAPVGHHDNTAVDLSEPDSALTIGP